MEVLGEISQDTGNLLGWIQSDLSFDDEDVHGVLAVDGAGSVKQKASGMLAEEPETTVFLIPWIFNFSESSTKMEILRFCDKCFFWRPHPERFHLEEVFLRILVHVSKHIVTLS